MSELLPCPFCGGEAEFNTYKTTCSVDCPKCRIGTYQVSLDDYKSAVEAWNTRYERTCHDVGAMFKSLWECSECGWECCDTYSCESAFSYCPNCGAKVVDA